MPDLLEELDKQNLQPNKTTLYRLLERLVAEGAVEEVLLDSKITFYELKDWHQHYHFTCTECQKIICLENQALEKKINDLEKELASQGLEIKEYQFSLKGKCKNCAQ